MEDYNTNKERKKRRVEGKRKRGRTQQLNIGIGNKSWDIQIFFKSFFFFLQTYGAVEYVYINFHTSPHDNPFFFKRDSAWMPVPPCLKAHFSDSEQKLAVLSVY